MANINRTQENQNQNFKQIEGDSWSSVYLPAICAGVVMTIVLLMAVSCSKKSDNAAAKIAPPVAPAVENSAPTTTAVAVPQAPRKAIKKHRPANATYVNSMYGVSFSYPHKYSLQSGDTQKEIPVESGFAKPGATEIASVDMPDSGYPDTDFSSALLNVSVNSGMTAEECSQFATPSSVVPSKGDAPKSDAKTETNTETKTVANDAVKSVSNDSTQPSEPMKPTVVKLGSNEFSEIEQMKGTGERQSDLKYFHLFKNGACYEFALDVETSRKADEDLAQVDRGQIFKQLEKILTTAKIKGVQLPGVEKVETATSSQPSEEGKSTTSAQPGPASVQSEKAEMTTPAQK